MIRPLAARTAALALALLALALAPAARSQTDGRAAVVVRVDQPAGRFTPEAVTNVTLDAVYGQLTSPLAEPGLGWVRATRSVSYVRCTAWLGDGIPRRQPGWLTGCSVVRRDEKGNRVYDWTRLERVLDTLLASGVKPVLVCGGLPDALLSGAPRRNEMGAPVNRPEDLEGWSEMLAQLFRRLAKTYGAEELRTWYFEAWGAPDHDGSLADAGKDPEGALQLYCRLYDRFVAAADLADPRLRVGGPGAAGDATTLTGFLRHCARGTNSVTQKVGTRVDFVSWCRYGTVQDILRWNSDLRTRVETEFPELKGLRFVLCESGGGAVEGLRANTPYEAARIAALVDGNLRAEKGVDLIFRSGDLVDDHFDGFRPLVSLVGNNTVPLPAFRAFAMLARMGEERLKWEAGSAAAPDLGILATRRASRAPSNSVQALLYRYDPSVGPGAGTPAPLRVKFTGFSPRLLRLPLRIYWVRPGTSSPYEAWVAADRPRPASDELGRSLLGERPLAPDNEDPKEPPAGVFLSRGEATVDLELPPNSAVLLALGAEPVFDVDLGKRAERLQRVEEEFNAVVEVVRRRDYERAIRQLRALGDKYPDTWAKEGALQAILGIYEQDLRSPADAEKVRRELLELPLDDLRRLRLLERLRVDVIRREDAREIQEITRRIADLEQRLDAQRQWSVVRYPERS